MLLARSLLLALTMGLAMAAGAAYAAPSLRLASLDGGPTVPLRHATGGRSAILVFWRADCAPCLLEFEKLAELRAAAGAVPLMLVGLQPADRLRQGLQRLKLGPTQSWRALDDPAEALVRFGGAPPRLPLAVALNAEGEVCARRHGLLGAAIVEKWIKACGGGRNRSRPIPHSL